MTIRIFNRVRALCLGLFFSTMLCSCTRADDPKQNRSPQDRNPDEAITQFDVADGLELSLFAAEPMLLSPSNIDIDHLGRVWVCEVVNYRRRNGERKAGDRILVLEDTDGDGKADSKHVFYQNPDINSALGICVLGNRVIVSCAPNVFIFTDEDGDLKPDKKEVLFTKTGQPQHDHSVHAFVFGPDGRLYWNYGNTGKGVHDKEGKVVVDLAGNQVLDNRQPYIGGMVFRCRADGSNFEVVGHNFRNNYEVAVDSFGTLWQSDNDDDGNRGVRINFVMEYGNYGYRDEMTGAGWRDYRIGMREAIPERHWHLNDPGVVPNLIQTGGGSPTGILVYEGDLLPEKYRGQLIHCDAGPNVVRAYFKQNEGAGYKAEMASVIQGRDSWFRPSDVCVAPDGSLIVADWYDPGVGGHRMGDTTRGRLFRIAPPKSDYKLPAVDLSSASTAISSLASPNQATRYLAWQKLHKMGADAEAELLKVFNDSQESKLRARALWLLAEIPGRENHYVEQAMADADSDIRLMSLRIARMHKMDVLPVIEKLVDDESSHVRRECLIALRGVDSEKSAELWAKLAQQHDGKDRWYLEAIGIAAQGRWDRCLDAWLKLIDGNWQTEAGRDIVWRSRGSRTPELLAEILRQPKQEKTMLERYVRAFDFQSSNVSQPVLAQLAFSDAADGGAADDWARLEAATRFQGELKPDSVQLAALNKLLDKNRGTSEFVTLVDRHQLENRYPELLALTQSSPKSSVGIRAVQILVKRNQLKLFKKAIYSDDRDESLKTITAVGTSGGKVTVKILMALITNEDLPIERRRAAVVAIAKTQAGARALVKLHNESPLEDLLLPAAASALHAASWPDIKQEAAKLFPLPPSKDNKPLPSIDELVGMKGDRHDGRVLFFSKATCAKCHAVLSIGKSVGPDLTEIGTKLSRQALFDSILFPSAGISHNFETYTVVLDDGTVTTGIVTSRTADSITIKDIESVERTYAMDDVDEVVKQDISLMPADIQKVLTAEELVNVVEFLTTLKRR